MAKFKCKKFKKTTAPVCKDWKGGKDTQGRPGKKCASKKKVPAKRCAEYEVVGNVRGGLYNGGKVKRRAKRV